MITIRSLFGLLACALIGVAGHLLVPSACASPWAGGRPHDHLLPGSPRSIFETQRRG